MRKILLIIILCFSVSAYTQELNCNVVINAKQTGNPNLPVFKTLENQIREFVNNTKWTKRDYTNQERIECSIYINITDYASDIFNGTIQIQSSRPVYGSSYTTPVHNINDKDFTFKYLEFQNMIYNPNMFESNLISVLAFHVYMTIGVDADTFSPNGGQEYFNQAQIILNYSQGENTKGWKLSDGNQNRYALIDEMLSPLYQDYRTVMYEYHRGGMDMMYTDQKEAKTNIANSIISLESMNRARPNSYILRTFFDAKADEIQDVFSGGPNVEITKLVSALNNVAPMYSNQWRNIKY
jgi:hypothetical protein